MNKSIQELLRQKLSIEMRYSNWSCNASISNATLYCIGNIIPPECEPYTVSIDYIVGKPPQCRVLNPYILPHSDIHMFCDGTLCLFYHEDLVWQNGLSISQLTIPWISEWVIFYEIYKRTGKWIGKESPMHLNRST